MSNKTVDIFNGDYVAVEKGALSLIKNALKRDKEKCLVARGEMLDILDSVTFEIKQLEEKKKCKMNLN